MDRLRIRKHDNHLARPLGERALDRLRHVNFPRPLLGADRVAVEGVHDRIAAVALGSVTRRQDDEHGPVDGIPLQIAFERFPVNRDPLHARRTGAGHHVRNRGLDLAKGRFAQSREKYETQSHAHGTARQQFQIGHVSPNWLEPTRTSRRTSEPAAAAPLRPEFAPRLFQ